jgi:hypothetical protein
MVASSTTTRTMPVWRLRYVIRDQHVKELGMWIDEAHDETGQHAGACGLRRVRRFRGHVAVRRCRSHSN